MTANGAAALTGLKVVEFAQLVAGPMAGSLLADLGADVVHVEDPSTGDPLRRVRASKDGAYLWWKIMGRNKRSATLDLRVPEGQELARSLIRWADVVVSNMRPGTMERWGLDFESARAVNPKIIMAHVTGFGLTSSLRDAPGFGKVGEAMSGVVHLTGFPDGPPVHTGFSHGDTLAGAFAALGIQAALYRRSLDPGFAGELVDLALFEPLFRLADWQVIEHDVLGTTPTRHGNQLEGSKGSVVNLFKSKDDQWLTVSAGTPKSTRGIASLLGEEIPEDASPDDMVALDLNRRMEKWVGDRLGEEVVATLKSLGIVAWKIYDAADIVADPTYAERGDILEMEDADFGSIRMPDVVPRLSEHRGRIWRLAPALGEDNDLVYRDWLGLEESEYEGLRSAGVI